MKNILKKINSKTILYMCTYIMILGISIMEMFSYYLDKYRLIENYDKINPIYIIIVALIGLIIIYIKDIIKGKKIGIYDYIFYITIIIGILVCIFSINKLTSIIGKECRHEGFLAILTYNLLFINWKRLGNKEDAVKIYRGIIWIAFFNVMYSLLQVYTNYDFIIRSGASGSATGFLGHNNFFGSLMVIVLSMMSCEFLINKKFIFKKICMLILFLIGLINCQSTGPILAYIITLIFILIFLFIKKLISIKKFLIIIIAPVVLFVSIYSVNYFVFKNTNCELCNIKENIIDNGGNSRIYIWKASMEVALDNPILGVGYDNLFYAYPTNQRYFELKSKGIIYNAKLVDNAHNVYLHIFASTGIFNLIIYIVLCLLVFIKGLKSNDKLSYIFLSGFVGYSIQAFTNLSVIQVAPVYYLIIGIILSLNNKVKG